MSFIKSFAASASLMAMARMDGVGVELGFTLADLAGMNTDEVKAIESRLFPAGLFGVKCTSAQLGMNAAKEGLDPETGEPYLPLFFVEFKYEVLEAQPLDKKVDADSLVSRVVNHRITFWPKSFNDEIGLVKGSFQKLGLDTSGVLGGMEGGEPGWLDGIVDHMFAIKINHSKPNAETGAQRLFIDFQRPKKVEEEA